MRPILSITCLILTVICVAEGRSPRRCPPCPPFELITPICGSDGKLYKSPCDMESARCWLNDEEITEVPWNDCKPSTCNPPCTYDYWPVCGEDGNIYNGNRCTFLYESCGRDTPLNEAPMDTCENGDNSSS